MILELFRPTPVCDRRRYQVHINRDEIVSVVIHSAVYVKQPMSVLSFLD